MAEDLIQQKRKTHRNWSLIIIFLVGFSFRLYGIDWGLPHFFHPDERQIMFKVTDISLKDPNPHFFAYGSFPIYLLKGVVVALDKIDWKIIKTIEKTSWDPKTKRTVQSLFPRLSNFRGQTITGRALSALFSAWTILIVYAIANILYRRKTALVASFLFACTVLSIQQAHFYVVDGLQTFFVSMALLFMIKTLLGQKARYYYFSGIFIGLAMATKFSTLPILLAYLLTQVMILVRRKNGGWFSWIHCAGGLFTAFLIMTAGMPYWLLDFKHWWHDVNAQRRMVTGIARLPYTIQYIHTMPFGYVLKNMVLWSLGLPLGIAALFGLLYAVRRIFKTPSDEGNIILLAWVLPIFILDCTFQVKFLRYTLPILPMMAVFTARWLMSLQLRMKKPLANLIVLCVIAGAFFWSWAFISIYSSENTRVQASNWVYENIPSGSHILIESSWDDALPVSTSKANAGIYDRKKLEIYKEPDNRNKADNMAEKLVWGDVIILASKRHYGSVLRVPDRYPISGNFYRSLFSERLGYKFVKSFTNPPHIGPIRFNDDLADESFRVYEHPKVNIFVKERQLTKEQILAYLISPPPDVKKITYNEILKAVPTESIGSRIAHPVFRWLMSIELLGIICFPVMFHIFHRFTHRGYPLSKVAGLLVAGYFCWLLPSLKLIPFSQTLIFFVLTTLLLVNVLLYLKSFSEINLIFRKKWWSVVGYEFVFFSVFFLFVFLKSYNPDIFWSESSMDFGFINSILRSDYFPPVDPWIQGEVINYYYYGHYLVSFLTCMSGIEPAYAYNLFFATIPALVALAISSLLIALSRRIWVGLLGILFSIIIGNLDGFVQLVRYWVFHSRNTQWEPIAKFIQSIVGSVLVLGRSVVHFRFFRSAHELINPTVHEFPFWSYNFMDLHAHTIATLISTFIITLQLVLFRNKARGFHIFGKGLSGLLTAGVLAISIGALNPTNSWDFPTQVLMMVMISLWIYWFCSNSDQRIEPLGEHYAEDRDKNRVFHTTEQDGEMHNGESRVEGEYYPEPETGANSTDKPGGEDENDIKDESTLDIEQDGVIDRQGSDSELSEADIRHEDIEKEESLNIGNQGEDISREEIIGSNVIIDEAPQDSSHQNKTLPLFSWWKKAAVWGYREIISDLIFLYELFFPVGVVIAVSLLLYLPYFQHFSRSNMGVGTLWQYKQTTNMDGFLTMFGLFMFIVITQLVKWWSTCKTSRNRSLLRVFMSVLMVFILVLIAYILFKTVVKIDYSVLFLSLILGYFAVYILFKGSIDEDQSFILLLLIMALAVIAGCEIFFVKDFYQGGDHRRFNTIFKFYMQVWFFLSIVSAYLVGQRLKIRAVIHRVGKGIDSIRRYARWAWTVSFIFLLMASLVFTVIGPWARRHHDEYQRVNLPLTLDGLAYMKQGVKHNEYRAIHWLNENVRGTPVILEATGPDYRYEYGRISANTGLPTVLGWWSHVDQRQYRRKYVEIRHDIKMIYESVDIQKILELLRKYCIKYIYIGLTEKNQAQYDESGLTKFKELTDFMTPVYSNPDVVIYQVNDYGLNVDYAKAMTSKDVLAELRERKKKEEAKKAEREAEKRRLKKERTMRIPPRTMFQGGQGEARGMFNEPRSLCVASNGDVYVADFRNHRVQKFDASGKWVTMWGSTGDGPGQFNDICDVSVDEKGVYVLDTFNNRIQKFDSNGAFLSEWRNIKGNLFYPRGIAADGKGYIYISDTGHHRIVKVDQDGKFILEWGGLGDDPGQFEDPIGICIHQEKVYVADVKNHRIQIFDLNGKFLQSISIEGWEGDVFVEPYLAVDKFGKIWVSDPTADRVIVYDMDGRKIKSIGRKYHFAHPMGIAISHTGNVLVVDTHHHRIVALSPTQ